MNRRLVRYGVVQKFLRDRGDTVLGEAELIDPYFDKGSFLMPAFLGDRSRRRSWVREMAATHTPPLKVLVAAGDADGNFKEDVLRVDVVGLA